MDRDHILRLIIGAGDGVGIVPGPNPGDKPDTPEQNPDAPLGEGGIKALQAERDARADAERQLKDLQVQLDAINAEKLTDLEKAQKAADDAAGLTQAAEAAKAQAETEAARWRFAATNGVPPQWVNRLQGSTEEELAADWESLKPTLAPAEPGKGTYVSGEGRQPETPPSMSAQIAAAEAEGDTRKALALKAQMIADLAHK